MTRLRACAMTICTALSFGGLTLPGSASAAGPAPYVVVLHDAVADPGGVTTTLSGNIGFTTRFRYAAALRGFAASLTAAQLSRVLADPRVSYVEPDITFTATGLVGLAAGETVPPGIRRVGAATTTQVHAPSGVNVAVLDTGIDLANGDLTTATGTNCIKAGAAAQDDNGHGTNVAGILGARDQGAGVAGVAPGTKLYAVKVLGSNGSGTLSQILCGINWVTANAAALNIQVANLSFAGGGANDGSCGTKNNDAEHQAICRATSSGVTFVAAAGNNATSLAKYIPAAYPEVLTVTSMVDTDGAPGGKGPVPTCVKGQKDDTYSTTSNYAATSADQSHVIAAPGTCVSSDKLGGGTSVYDGTSQAAPHVAGTVALCLDDGGTPGPCAGLAPAQIIVRMRADAAAADTTATAFLGDPLRPVTGKYFGPLVAAAGY